MTKDRENEVKIEIMCEARRCTTTTVCVDQRTLEHFLPSKFRNLIAAYNRAAALYTSGGQQNVTMDMEFLKGLAATVFSYLNTIEIDVESTEAMTRWRQLFRVPLKKISLSSLWPSHFLCMAAKKYDCCCTSSSLKSEGGNTQSSPSTKKCNTLWCAYVVAFLQPYVFITTAAGKKSNNNDAKKRYFRHVLQRL